MIYLSGICFCMPDGYQTASDLRRPFELVKKVLFSTKDFAHCGERFKALP